MCCRKCRHVAWFGLRRCCCFVIVFPVIPETIKRPLRDWLWRKLALSWLLSSGVKIEVRSHGDWYIYNEIFVGGEYDMPLRNLIKSSAADGGPPATVLDLGANVGFFFLRWLHLWRMAGSPGVPPRFVLVEGSGRSCAEMRRRLAEQPAKGVDVKILHNLVGPRTGSATITDSHIHFGNQVTSNPKAGVSVSYVDLVAWCEGVKSISLIKCDIEGSEEVFLESQPELLAKSQALAIELHHDSSKTARCREIVERTGFQCCEVLRQTKEFSVLYYQR